MKKPNITAPTPHLHTPHPNIYRPTPVFWSVCFLFFSWLVIIAATAIITYYFAK